MSNKERKGCLWYVGYAIGFVITRTIRIIFDFVCWICKMIWKGSVKACMVIKKLVYIWLGMLLLLILLGIILKNPFIPIVFSIAVFAIMGVWYDEKYEKPTRKRRECFDRMFQAINFKASDESFPYFLGERDISEFITVYSFNTLIPLDKWRSNKFTLEMYMNVKLADIKQDSNNNRVIHLHIRNAPLPEYAEWRDDYLSNDNILNIGIGYSGVVGMDLEKDPHAFIAGKTGCGKSNVLKCMIHQALQKDYDVVLVDFKRGVSFSDFSDYIDIIYDYKEALGSLKELVTETNNRLDYFRRAKVDNIKDYNLFTNGYLNRKVVFIDELAELLKPVDKQTSKLLYDAITTLTRLSRAVGINLIMGIQRPDSTVVTGQIKNNVSYRVCGRFNDPEPSRIMLNNDMANTLPDIKGRFIAGDDDLQEVQCFNFINYNRMKKAPLSLTDGGVEEDTEEFEPHIDDEVISEPEVATEEETEDDFEFDFSEF